MRYRVSPRATVWKREPWGSAFSFFPVPGRDSAFFSGWSAFAARLAVGRDVGRAAVLGEAGLRTAQRPRFRALTVQHLLGDGDLLVLGGLVGARGVLRAAVARPGALRELQTTVEAVSVVDGPVARGLALGDLVPGADRGGLRIARADEREGDTGTARGECERGAGHSAREPAVGLTTVTTASGHRAVPLLRLRGELSDSGWSCPAAREVRGSLRVRLHPKPCACRCARHLPGSPTPAASDFVLPPGRAAGFGVPAADHRTGDAVEFAR